MGVVIRRILERTDLAPAGLRPEAGVRKGITFVPKHGVPVVMREAPKPAAPSPSPPARPVSVP